jgi:wyosine [tRNA(Phe)-imidazoG37] synthetase (radical SAM superfamily)
MKESEQNMNPNCISRIESFIKSKILIVSDKMENSIINNPSSIEKIIFGPVPSRRLGSSLGINNIKRKICTYDCIYCQCGKTSCCSMERDCCLSPYELYYIIKRKIQELEKAKVKIDYICFATNGEPTIDNNLAKEIGLLREFGYKIAVLTNGSLLWNDNVKENLYYADYVSVKVDTVVESTWEIINRPHPRLRFTNVLDGVKEFVNSFRGILTTETMLVKGVNDNIFEMEQITTFLKSLKRDVSYFTTPIRPPSEKYAVSPDAKTLEELSLFLTNELPNSEMLFDNEIGDFNVTGDFEKDFLGILSVHPMRENAVKDLYKHNNVDLVEFNNLISTKKIEEINYLNQKFYKRIYN